MRGTPWNSYWTPKGADSLLGAVPANQGETIHLGDYRERLFVKIHNLIVDAGIEEAREMVRWSAMSGRLPDVPTWEHDKLTAAELAQALASSGLVRMAGLTSKEDWPAKAEKVKKREPETSLDDWLTQLMLISRPL